MLYQFVFPFCFEKGFGFICVFFCVSSSIMAVMTRCWFSIVLFFFDLEWFFFVFVFFLI